MILLSPDSTAEVAFLGDNGNAAVNKEGAGYKTTFSGFPWEAIPDAGRLEALTDFVEWCAVGSAPSINVSPLSIVETLGPDASKVLTMTIGNSGNSDLEWTVEESSSGACNLPSDIPWLDLSTSGGTTTPGQSEDEDVTLNSFGMSPGNYTGSLCVASNDDSAPMVPVAVTMEVTPYTVYLPIILNAGNVAAQSTAPIIPFKNDPAERAFPLSYSKLSV